MKKLCCLVILLAGCSSNSEYLLPYFVDMDTEQDSSVDAASDTDSDTEVDAGYDSGTDAGEDAGVTDLPCDGGACCSTEGFVFEQGVPCVADVLPENMSEGFDPATWVPMQFRCTEPDVCGSGEERRLGHTACDGSAPSCRLDNFVWGLWETSLDESALETVCNPLFTDGAVVWEPTSSGGIGRSRYYCIPWGCEEGECITGNEIGSGECGYGECGEYCFDDWFSDFNCGECGNSCFDQGGASCDNTDGPTCMCGENPACDEGNRCVWSDVIEDFTCIPE